MRAPSSCGRGAAYVTFQMETSKKGPRVARPPGISRWHRPPRLRDGHVAWPPHGGQSHCRKAQHERGVRHVFFAVLQDRDLKASFETPQPAGDVSIGTACRAFDIASLTLPILVFQNHGNSCREAPPFFRLLPIEQFAGGGPQGGGATRIAAVRHRFHGRPRAHPRHAVSQWAEGLCAQPRAIPTGLPGPKANRLGAGSTEAISRQSSRARPHPGVPSALIGSAGEEPEINADDAFGRGGKAFDQDRSSGAVTLRSAKRQERSTSATNSKNRSPFTGEIPFLRR